MPVDRRQFLAAAGAAGLTAVAGGTGCAVGRGRPVRIAVVWSGWELESFQAVLRPFRDSGYDVRVLPIGDDINALLGSRVARASAADVVMVPQPASLANYASQLVPLAAGLVERFPPAWRRLVQDGAGVPRGVWFKASHLSLVWYRADLFDRLGLVPPRTWEEWLVVNRQLVVAGVPPLAIGAADGWVLSQWFDNALIGESPRVHRELARPPGERADPSVTWEDAAVVGALRRLAEMWSPPGTFPDGAAHALSRQFEDSVIDVFRRRHAAMVAGADFVHPVIARHAHPDAVPRWFRFPAPAAAAPGPSRIIVGGDIAVLLRPASSEGHALVRWLASADAHRIWAGRGGYISVHRDVGPDAYSKDLAFYTATLLDEVRSANQDSVVFALGDQLTGRLGVGSGAGLWRVLQNFLGEIGAGRDPTDAATRTAAALDRLDRSER